MLLSSKCSCRFLNRSSSLFLVDLNDVVLLHLQSFRSLVVIDAATVKQEPSKLWNWIRKEQNHYLTWGRWRGHQPSRCRTSWVCPSGWSASRGSGSRWSPGRQPAHRAVSLSLLHSHTCIIYEANMRHIWEKYAAFMMQISIIFFKNEVLSTTIFKYCQNIIKLLFWCFNVQL